MHIVATALVSIVYLGVAITPGWSPGPADLTTPYTQQGGSTAEARGSGRGKDKIFNGTSCTGNVKCDSAVSGGQTYQRQNKPESARLNPAINRLSGDGMGGGSVGGSKAGSAGAVPSGRRTTASNAGSSSGINTTSSKSGSASSNTSGPMHNMVSGGCPGCGKRDTVRQPR